MRLRYHRTNFIGCDCAGNKCIPMNHERIIENISRSMPLRRHEIDFFTARLSHKKIRRRQYILQADDLCRHYTFVNEGCLRLFHVDAGGSEHILQFAPEDYWVADIGSFHKEIPTYLRYLAAEPPAINQKPTGKAELFRTSGARGARRMIPRFQDSMIPARPELETCNNEVPESYDRKPINLEP